GVTVASSPDALGRRDTGTCPHADDTPVPNAPAINPLYRAKAWIGRLGPAESPLGALHIERAGAPRDIGLHAVQGFLACATLALLALVAVLTSPIQRSSASDSLHPPQGLRCNFAIPASDSPRLSVAALIVSESTVVTARSEDDEEDDEPYRATREAYD